MFLFWAGLGFFVLCWAGLSVFVCAFCMFISLRWAAFIIIYYLVLFVLNVETEGGIFV